MFLISYYFCGVNIFNNLFNNLFLVMETNKTFDRHKYDYLFLEHCTEEQKHSIMRELGYEFSHETGEIKININFLKFVEDNGLFERFKRLIDNIKL